jgi:dTMP kinase
MENIKNGKFIVIEGLDGSGKDTQAALLHQALPDSILGYAPTREGKIQEVIREELINPSMIKTDEELFLSYLMHTDRIYQTWNTKNGIYKTLTEDKKHYISVRYSLSSKVYNSKQMDTGDLLKPNLTIFLDIKPEDSLKRIQERNKTDLTNIERYENLEKLTEVREKYLHEIEIMKEFGHNVLVVDATQEITTIHNLIMNHSNIIL